MGGIGCFSGGAVECGGRVLGETCRGSWGSGVRIQAEDFTCLCFA